jgi:DNA processing protein
MVAAMLHREWLVLAHAYLSVAELEGLKDRFGDIATIASQSASRLRGAGLSDKKAQAVATPDEKSLARALRWLETDSHSIIACGNEDYPELLSQISGAPLLLFINGNVDALHLPSIAMVGSRNPTRGGIQSAVEFSRHLARGGYSIISGLAEGIDTAAHRGALDADGTTVAILGHGIDRVYPAQNHELAHQIAARGALVSEYPIGAPPDKRHFPERNRLISGLALGTLVVEAARRSGSLITARLAAEQGREVFALPGSIHNPLARGCHELIRQGAKLVESAADIHSELKPLADHLLQYSVEHKHGAASALDADEDYIILRKTLGFDPATMDELHTQSGLTIDQLSSMLLILELQGEVEAHSGGRYTLIA